jgi:hypothetical protein
MNLYDKLETIGAGSFGKVNKIRRKSDGKMLVWKELNYGKMSEKEKQVCSHRPSLNTHTHLLLPIMSLCFYLTHYPFPVAGK